jgi:hypothetical protein
MVSGDYGPLQSPVKRIASNEELGLVCLSTTRLRTVCADVRARKARGGAISKEGYPKWREALGRKPG